MASKPLLEPSSASWCSQFLSPPAPERHRLHRPRPSPPTRVLLCFPPDDQAAAQAIPSVAWSIASDRFAHTPVLPQIFPLGQSIELGIPHPSTADAEASLPPNPPLCPMKERAQKLESWREKEKLKAQKKAEYRELLRKQSSLWVAEDKMEKKILEAILHTTPL